MKNKEMRLPQDIYFQHLYTIEGIGFTHREIDAIAFIVSGRTTKKIASFLSIAPKTVDNHIHNIMMKLECHSRESIIDFVEKSGKFSILRQYYLSSLIKSSFKKKLEEISRLRGKAVPTCLLVFGDEEEKQDLTLGRLIRHLKLAGIKTSITSKQQHEAFTSNSKNTPAHTLFIMQVKDLSILAEERESNDDEFSLIFKLTEDIREKSGVFTFVLLNRDEDKAVPKLISDRSYVEFREQENYYFSVLSLLKRILPGLNFDKIISEFTRDCSLIHDSSNKTDFQDDLPSSSACSQTISSSKKKRVGSLALHVLETLWHKLLTNIKRGLFQKAGCWFGFFLLLSFVALGYLNSMTPNFPIRSNVLLPKKSVLLDRPKLITELDNAFKEQTGIQTVALIGIGGTGKTTLALQYAHTQKASFIWQIKADTLTSFKDSFQILAYALAQTEEDKKILHGLQDIKNTGERDAKFILFAQDKMKAHPHWLLIFDNVEVLQDILPYFPNDAAVWGPGKIILTTRDINIQHNKHISHVIVLGELDDTQKLRLFLNIMASGFPTSPTVHTQREQKKIKDFLTQIPSFPLDVSLAAYYIKTTSISYDKYLYCLNQLAEEFEHVQENILKDSGDYTKTRYHIVALSLKKLMETHRDFGDLLLFMSLLDSQHIPRDLLSSYKNDPVVDNFIHHLKKYSLVMDENISSSVGPMLSMHRSTQGIGVAYLTEALDLKHNHKLLKTISTTLENYMADAIDKDDLERIKLLIAHCEWFLKHPQLLEDKEKEAVTGELGGLYFYLKNYPKAQQVLEEILHKEGNDLHAASIFIYLGLVYKDLAEHKKAKVLFEKSLSLYKQKDPEDHLRIAQIISYLGSLEGSLGNYEKARELLEESLLMHKQYNQHAPLQRARVQISLGNLYRELSEYEKAKELLEDSILIYKKHTPENHVRTAWALATLGSVYRSLGQYSKAKDLQEKSLAMYKKNYPDNHVSVAWASTHLGNTYRKLGQYGKAKDLLEKSYSIYTTYFNDNHSSNAWVLTHLGNLYKELGDDVRAKEALEKGYRIYKAHNLGTLWSGAQLGNFYREQGQLEKAKELLNKSYATYQEHPAERDVRLSMLFRYLGNLSRDSGNYQEAKEFLKNSQALYTEICGENHIETARVIHDLGKTYLLEGDLETAEQHLQNALRIIEQAQYPDVTRVLETLADLESKKAKVEEGKGNSTQTQTHKTQARAYLKKALEVARAHLPEESLHIRRIQSKLTLP